MSTSIGTAQASQTFANSTTRATNNTCYVTRFVSTPINQTGIAANTWTYNFACKNSNTTPTDDYPTGDSSIGTKVPICCYVWRPSTGVKVGNIFDGDSATGYFDTGNQNSTGATTSEVAEHGTFAGSAVASAAANDVIIFEAWIYTWIRNTTAVTLSYFYDGTTTNTTSGTIVSNHAAYLETPENITLAGTNQNITKSLTSTVTISSTVARLAGKVRTDTETVAISSTPTTQAAKKRALTETISISTDPGSPSFIKAHNVNKALTETVTIGATTPVRVKGAVKPITTTVTINTPAPTYIQHPNRIRKTLTENVSINSTVVKKSSKTRTLLN
jgi:hypothetical protein